MALKFGRRPPVHTRRTFRLGLAMARALDQLGAPPLNSDDYTGAVEKLVGIHWQMLGNDSWGCCVEASDGHELMLRTANVGRMVTPTTANVLSNYSAETGFNPNAGPPGANPTDNGTDETTDSSYMVSNGLLGHKAAATGPIDPSNLTNMRWGVQLFGLVKLGINVTQAMMDQFNAGQDWSFVANSQVIGGHAVPMVRYYADGSIDIITWGRRHHCVPNFLSPSSQIVDEAHANVFPDWIRASGTAPPGFNLKQLLADAAMIEAQS